MSPHARSAALGELGTRLRALREEAGLTGGDLASALGDRWRQPKVSKIETGRQLPTPAELIAWAGVVGASPEPLLELRARAAVEYGSHQDRHSRAGGPVGHQQDLTALAESCTFLAEFQPSLVPGYLQTPAYMRGLAETDPTSAGDLGHVIAVKVRRQAILYEPGRTIVHVLGEAALHTRIGTMSVTTVRSQLTHLADSVELPGHTLAVVPFSVPVPIVPASGFSLYDRDLVTVETLAGVLQLTEPDAVARHSRWLDQLVDSALTGAAAADFCRQVAAALPD